MPQTFGKIQQIMKRILKSYLQITAVMVINVGLVYVLLTLISQDFGQSAGSSEVSDRKNVTLEKNLAQLNERIFDGYHANLRHILESCGIPDGYAGQIDGELELIYFYDRFGTDDWVAYVSLKNGMLTGIGYNDSSVNDHSDYLEWEFTENEIPTYR